MLLHIPHSQTKIPEWSVVSPTSEDFNLLTDWCTDELFVHPESERVVFPYSRLFCDVERYRDDKDEVMVSKGHGVVYTKGATGNVLPRHMDDKEMILSMYYDKHHLEVKQSLNRLLSLFPTVVVVDCHSFHPVKLEHEESDNRPDFCLGFNERPPFLDDMIALLESNGYTVGLNDPFSGTYIPNGFENDSRVLGVMIEVNRSLYLTDKYTKNSEFNKTKEVIKSLLDIISNYERECDI